MKRIVFPLLALLVLGAVGAALLAWPRDEFIPAASKAAWAPTPANLARGAYLARAGDCLACHTARGAAPYAGGRVIDTPFGSFATPNITPDTETGIGTWTADDFWNALHNGRAPGGRLLYPAFPYTNYTKMPREDADALFAWLRSLPPQNRPNRPHTLRFPYDRQWALAGWRLLYFRPGVHASDRRRSAEWNRGAYLVEGPGHCGACHSARNVLGASDAALSGGLVGAGGWYAPALASGRDPGELARLLRTGVAPGGAVFGPMADVVAHSLQYLDERDVRAMAVYLGSLPAAPEGGTAAMAADGAQMKLGKKLYDKLCADCHGADGGGANAAGGAPAYAALAGNRTLTMDQPANAIRIVLHGGFPPATQGNPRPYGMPPFSPVLSDAEAAAVVTYVRNSWGNAGRAVTAAEVNRYRAVPLD